MSELSDFTSFLFAEDLGYVYVPSKEPETNEWSKDFFKWPEQKPQLHDFVERQGSIKDVYISPVLWRSPIINITQFKSSRVAYTEFDGNALSSDDNIYEPSLRIQSSSIQNQHVYYRLDKPITDALELEKINRVITYANAADPSAWDITQVLRPPGTKNFKYQDLPTVKVLYMGSEVLHRALFKDLPEPRTLVKEIKEFPDVMSVIAKYAWQSEDFDFFMREEIAEGSRSSAMMRLGHVCAEAGMSPPDAYAILDDADKRWKKYLNRNDRPARLLEIINKAFATRAPKISKLSILTVDELLDMDFDDQDWIIDRVLLPSTIGVIYSQPGVGKTRFSIDLGMHLACGENYLDWEITKPYKVMLLSLEMNESELQEFMKEMPLRDTIKHQDFRRNFLMHADGSPIDMDKANGQELVYEIVREFRPDILMIDSLGAAVSTDVSSNVEVKQFFRFVGKLRKDFGTALWLIHHGRKATNENKQPKGLGDLYGSVYIGAEATTVYCMLPTSDSATLHPVKGRFLRDKTIKNLGNNEAGFQIHKVERKGTSGDPLAGGLL